MTSWRFCKQRPDEQADFKKTILDSLKEKRPISVLIGHAPNKNLNNCQASQVDWAELFSLSQLALLNKKIKQIYAPGLKIKFLLDDLRAEKANGIPREKTLSYLRSLEALIQALNLEHFFDKPVSLRELYQTFETESFLTQAKSLVSKWELAPENQEQLRLQRENAARNIPNFENLSPKEQKEQLERATHLYRVYHQAEILSGIWSIPGSLYARFYGHSGFWQLFTIRKGSVTQPWQGEGCLLLNSKNKLEPLVLTKAKQAKISSRLEYPLEKYLEENSSRKTALFKLANFQKIVLVQSSS